MNGNYPISPYVIRKIKNQKKIKKIKPENQKKRIKLKNQKKQSIPGFWAGSLLGGPLFFFDFFWLFFDCFLIFQF